MGKDTDQIKREIEDTRERMGATADALGYKADVPSRVRENIGDRIDGVRGAIGDKVDDVRGTIAQTASDVGRRSGNVAHAMIENPLGMALGGLALGLLVGMAIPVTDFERERLGPLADQLKDSVAEKGQDVVERGRDVLQQAATAAVGEMTGSHSHMYTSEDEQTSRAPVTE